MNKIDIENQTRYPVQKKDIENIANDVLKKFDVKNSFLEIIFASKDNIHKLNAEHRNINSPTDVLSFPQPEIKASSTRILGSIVVSLEVVNEKNEDSTDVIKHGLLHLLGYDHEENEKLWQIAAAKINCNL